MNLVEKMRNCRNYIASFFAAPENAVDIAEAGLIDVYLEKMLQILYWQSTERTLRAFFLLNTLYWVILMINLRVYGIIALLGLISFIYDALRREALRADYKGEYSAVVKEMKTASCKTIDILHSLRRDSRLVFYPSATLFFLALHMISKSAPGALLLYLSFVGVFFLPVGFQLLPEHVTVKLREAYNTLSSPKCILAEDELIPFIQGKDFNKRDADLESLMTDRTADSVTTSLASGITSMPSYLEVSETPNDDIQEEDLIPRAASKVGLSFTPAELSSDSDSSDNREIKFDSDHFNTSSSEDDPYSKGLQFPKNIVQVNPTMENEATLGMFRSMINTVSGNVVTNMFQSAIFGGNRGPSTSKKAPSESDSDFEIVDPDEIEGDDDLKKNN